LHGDVVWGDGGRIAICNVIAMGPFVDGGKSICVNETREPLLTVVVFGIFSCSFQFMCVDPCCGKTSIAKLFPSNLLLFLYNLLIFFWKFGWDDWWLWPVLKAKEKKLN